MLVNDLCLSGIIYVANAQRSEENRLATTANVSGKDEVAVHGINIVERQYPSFMRPPLL
jgi:hypothetical protein